MKSHLRLSFALTAVLAVILVLSLTLAGAAEDGKIIKVKNVDQFLAALGSGRTVILAEGEYNLAKAKDYGKQIDGRCYGWKFVGDGYELDIKETRNLEIIGAGREGTSIVNEPRYANVITFTDCADVGVFKLTAGHTKAQGYCSGGVLNFNRCRDIDIEDCCLYGCGTYGITACESRDLSAERCIIKECSYGAFEFLNCSDVTFEKGLVFDCGLKETFCCFELFSVCKCADFSMNEVEVRGSRTERLFNIYGSSDAEIASCRFTGNTVKQGVFSIKESTVCVADCSFASDDIASQRWYTKTDSEGNKSGFDYAVGKNGEKLEKEHFMQMKYAPSRGGEAD